MTRACTAGAGRLVAVERTQPFSRQPDLAACAQARFGIEPIQNEHTPESRAGGELIQLHTLARYTF